MQHEDKESMAQQERCRSQAQTQRGIELRLREEAEKKRADADIRCGLSGEAGIFGLTNDQKGWHGRARPYNETAAQLDEEATALERKANEAEKEANLNKQEIARLMDEVRTRDNRRRQNERKQGQRKEQIERAHREIAVTRQHISELKAEKLPHYIYVVTT